MERVEVEAVQERTGDGVAQAIILLRRVAHLPPGARFRLRPLDDAAPSSEARVVFETDHAPLAIFETEDGVALRIGPDLVESENLKPGSLLEIVLPEVEIRGEFRWPPVAPGQRIAKAAVDRFEFSLSAPEPLVASPAPASGGGGSTPRSASARIPRTIDTALPADFAAAVSAASAGPQNPPKRDEGLLQDAGTTPPTAPPPPARKGFSAGPAALLTAAALLVGGFLTLRMLDLSLVKRSVTARGETSLAHMQAPATRTAQMSIYEVLAAGPVSPRGVQAEGVSPARALQRAHDLLHGTEAQRDPEEAAYWLKRYLSATAGTEHTRVALTHLGSAFAQPLRGSADMASARIAWEMAGALGDPVAMCFLSAVYRSGLGVSADQATARTWHQRALAAGGACPTGPEGAPSGRN